MMRPEPEAEAEEPDHQEFEAFDDQLGDLDDAEVGPEVVVEMDKEDASIEDAQAEAVLRLLLDEIIALDAPEGGDGPAVLQEAASLPAETEVVDITASCAAAPVATDPPASSQIEVATHCYDYGACSQTLSDHDLEQLVSEIEDPALVQEIIDSLTHESQMKDPAQPDGNANGQVTVHDQPEPELELTDRQPDSLPTEPPIQIPDEVDLLGRSDEKNDVSKDDMDDKEKLASAVRGIVIYTWAECVRLRFLVCVCWS